MFVVLFALAFSTHIIINNSYENINTRLCHKVNGMISLLKFALEIS